MPKTLKFMCPSCHTVYETESEHSGKKMNCPCGIKFRIPEPGKYVPPAEVSETPRKKGILMFDCPYCGFGFESGKDWAGRTMMCRKCGMAFKIPRPKNGTKAVEVKLSSLAKEEGPGEKEEKKPEDTPSAKDVKEKSKPKAKKKRAEEKAAVKTEAGGKPEKKTPGKKAKKKPAKKKTATKKPSKKKTVKKKVAKKESAAKKKGKPKGVKVRRKTPEREKESRRRKVEYFASAAEAEAYQQGTTALVFAIVGLFLPVVGSAVALLYAYGALRIAREERFSPPRAAIAAMWISWGYIIICGAVGLGAAVAFSGAVPTRGTEAVGFLML